MTREEAKDMFRNDKDAYGKPKSVMKKLDMIYDDFEGQNSSWEDIKQDLNALVKGESDYEAIEFVLNLLSKNYNPPTKK